jgi:transposase InsO family protein
LKIKCLRSENGGEITSDEFNEFYEDHGIRIHFSTTRTHQKNGVAQRKNKIVQEMARTVLNQAKLSDIFWRDVFYMDFHVLNRAQL